MDAVFLKNLAVEYTADQTQQQRDIYVLEGLQYAQ